VKRTKVTKIDQFVTVA